MMKKNILILNTGGTISSVKTELGYVPASGYVRQALSEIPALSHPEMPDYTIKEYLPLLDSSNMTVRDWNRIAADIAIYHDQYDGFIIFHGTDTMAYTASALSFMLENLDKPVILTGSQLPLSAVRNDAMDNVITSLWLCAHQPINEVCIYFNQCLLRGNRAQKVSAERFKAFDSPNFPHLADVGIAIQINSAVLLPEKQQEFRLQAVQDHLIANVRLFPGLSIDVLEYILRQPIRGLVLETYGAGNAPNNDPRFFQVLHDAVKRGIVIVNCSQCRHGQVEMHQYATGSALKAAGLISGHDMTAEAAHCKLLYLLSKYADVTQVTSLMEANICGELSLAE